MTSHKKELVADPPNEHFSSKRLRWFHVSFNISQKHTNLRKVQKRKHICVAGLFTSLSSPINHLTAPLKGPGPEDGKHWTELANCI